MSKRITGKLKTHTQQSVDKFVIINVSGKVFETRESTLNRFSDTLLGDWSKRRLYYVPSRHLYFFDRNPSVFTNILNFYQSGGRLGHRPPNVSLAAFVDELKFFQFDEKLIERIKEDEGILPDEEISYSETTSKCRKLWLLFEHPDSSAPASLIAILSVSIILISITLFCLETFPDFKSYNEMHAFENPFFIIETVCVIWFTLELILRFASCPDKGSFMRDLLNWFDLLAILPYFVENISVLMGLHDDNKQTMSLSIIRVVRLVRVFRIFKLSRHSSGLMILWKTLSASMRELQLLIFFLGISVVLFSSAIYFAEVDSSVSNFSSIPDAFWWAMTTLTGIGYGDFVPQTFAGKIVGAMCCLCSVLTITLTVPVIASNFNYFYHREKESDDSGHFEHVDVKLGSLPDSNSPYPSPIHTAYADVESQPHPEIMTPRFRNNANASPKLDASARLHPPSLLSPSTERKSLPVSSRKLSTDGSSVGFFYDPVEERAQALVPGQVAVKDEPYTSAAGGRRESLATASTLDRGHTRSSVAIAAPQPAVRFAEKKESDV